MMDKIMFDIGKVLVGQESPFFLIAGPCVIESKELCIETARKLKQIGEHTGVSIIYKASYDKANRSSIHSYRGPGLEKGLEILKAVKGETGLPILTDVHESQQAVILSSSSWLGEVVDCLQIPAFLCRQTDLVTACAMTHKPINIKKGQMLHPWDVKDIIEKITICNNNKIMITERGTFFGYNRLVNDMTAISTLQETGYPVVFDATHSTQFPSLGGQGQKAFSLAKAAVAAGANGLFIEVHPDPEKSKSDSSTIMALNELEDLLITCRKIWRAVR